MTEAKPADNKRLRQLWYGGALFVVALAARLLHLNQIREASFFGLLLGDSEGYDAWARSIAAGDWLGSEIFYQAPLYPYLLGGIYALFGRQLLLVMLLQAIAGAAACLLLADAGRRFFSDRAGLVAGAMLALYPAAIYYEARIDKSSLDLFFLCLALSLLGRAIGRPRPWTWAVTGGVFGTLALTRENALVLFAAVLLWLGLEWRRGAERSGRFALLFVLGLAAVLAPVALRNGIVGGELHLTTAQLGPNFYIGNNPAANGSYQPLRHGRGTWKHERRDAAELAQEMIGRELSPREISRFWFGRALDYIAANPGDWLGHKWVTFRLLCNAVEIGDAEDPYTYADRSVVMRLFGPLLHFGTLVPLALAGVWIAAGLRRRLWPLYLMLGAYGASVVLFYVLGRYRHPLVPLLLLFAAAALVGAQRWWSATGRRERSLCLAATLAAALFCNWPMISRDSMRAVTEMNVAGALLARGATQAATDHFERAVTLEPDLEVAHFNLANLLRSQGRSAAAIEHYREVIRLRPDYFEAYNNWGTTLLDQRRFDEAAVLFRQVLQLDPESVPAHYNLGEVGRLRGDAEEAIRFYRRALVIDPEHVPSRQALERMLNIASVERAP